MEFFHSMTFDTTHPLLNGFFYIYIFIPFLDVLGPLQHLSNDKVDPWGVTKGVERPKMRVLEETHENGQKIMKKNEKLSIFASELLNIVVGHTICTRSWTVGWSGCPWGSQNDLK